MLSIQTWTTLTISGRRFGPYFKTDWNPDLVLGHNMINHLGVYRRSLIEEIGRLRAGFEGSQDYDLMLRAADASTPESHPSHSRRPLSLATQRRVAILF